MLRFPVNSMQCANATGKAALQYLLDRADVVVMDLLSLSEQNRGVAYEIGKLVDEVPLNRVVLLFDESTDLKVLKEILVRAYEAIAADSPNRQSGGLRVRVFDMGDARKPDQSADDWKRRMRTRVNEHALVGLLFDAAQPPRSATAIDPKRDWAAVRWSRIAMPRWLRWVFNAVWWAFLFSVAKLLPARAFRMIVGSAPPALRHATEAVATYDEDMRLFPLRNSSWAAVIASRMRRRPGTVAGLLKLSAGRRAGRGRRAAQILFDLGLRQRASSGHAGDIEDVIQAQPP
jgi:hypothetical protein